MLDEYTERLSKEIDLEIKKDLDKNLYELIINENVEVTVKDLEPGVLFFSRMTVVHKDFREELFTYIMRANLLGVGTFDSVIGMESDEKFLTLSRAMPYEVNYSTFKEALETFVNTLNVWREEVTEKYEQAKQSFL